MSVYSKMNIEHPTSNVECGFSAYCVQLRANGSMFSVGCSMLDVHLLTSDLRSPTICPLFLLDFLCVLCAFGVQVLGFPSSGGQTHRFAPTYSLGPPVILVPPSKNQGSPCLAFSLSWNLPRTSGNLGTPI